MSNKNLEASAKKQVVIHFFGLGEDPTWSQMVQKTQKKKKSQPSSITISVPKPKLMTNKSCCWNKNAIYLKALYTFFKSELQDMKCPWRIRRL